MQYIMRSNPEGPYDLMNIEQEKVLRENSCQFLNGQIIFFRIIKMFYKKDNFRFLPIQSSNINNFFGVFI